MQHFIHYLQTLNLSTSTQKAYIRHVLLFLLWHKKEIQNCTKKEIVAYLSYLQSQKNQESITRNNALIALKHYFAFLMKNEAMSRNPCTLLKIRGTQKRHLYRIYTADERQQIHDNFYHVFIRQFDQRHIPKNQRTLNFLCRQRNFVMLSLLLFQGISTNELQPILLSDMDFTKATILIRARRKSNARTLPLQAFQISCLLYYIENIRPMFFDFCEKSEQLFLPLPESGKPKTSNQSLLHTIKPLAMQVKSIDKNFINFKQIRASVIEQWLNTEGLRKAQYNAGHRFVSSTEKYVPNEIENLIQDIQQYNPY